mgnify:FL=1|jgi:hypothetical protein|tara:strand:+ start:36 stop:872 length:837 start_codon:yes stop_codon:yes gene_type:complete
MRLKHNKKRNTAFVYEALVRELTRSIVKNNKNKQNKIVSIMKEHFAQGTELNKELDLYKSVYETRAIEKRLAEKIVVEAKEKYSDLNKRTIFQEQSALINKINKTLSKNLFNNFVPNYKSIASVYSIFQEALPVKDRVLLEESIIQQMSQSCETQQEVQQPVDNIVYNTFVTKFNEEYSGILNESQKNLLGKYISSFSDNGVELKYYLNEEIGKLKEGLEECKKDEDVCNDINLKDKIDKVYSILEGYKEKEIDADLIEVVLKTQELVEEIKQDDSIS